MKHTKAERLDTYSRVTEEVIKHLENGVVVWQRGWNKLGLPKNIISGHYYRGWNVFWLNFVTLFKEYKTPYFLTYKQTESLGGHIKKGEKGHLIVYWATVESRTRFVTVKNGNTGEEDKKPATVLIPKGHIVFNIDQTDGLHLPTVEKLFATDAEKIEACEKVIVEMPQRPPIKHGGDRAYYHPKADYVQMPFRSQFKSNERYYQTLFHELGHSTGHQTRLNRKELVESDGFGNELYSKEELTAEFTSTFLCAVCGIEQPVIENSAAYLKGWLKALQDDKTLLLKAAAQAQRSTDFILNAKSEEEENTIQTEAQCAA